MATESASNIEVAWYLRQTKECLVNLQKAAYFTNDEWIAIDGIIHKGKYVFTNGPPKSLLDGSPLLMDTQIEDDIKTKAEISTIVLLDESSGREEVSHSDSASTPEPEEESSGPEWEPTSEEQSPAEATEDTLKFDKIDIDHLDTPVDKIENENPPTTDPVGEPTKEVRSGLAASVYHLPQLDIISPPTSPKYTSYTQPEVSSYKDPFLGYVFLAPYTVQSEQKIKLRANAGDKIQVTKLVSGTRYFGFNLTSSRKGQMPREFIEAGHPFKKQGESRPLEARTVAREAGTTIFDDIEETSADEWKGSSVERSSSFLGKTSISSSSMTPTGSALSRTRSLLSSVTSRSDGTGHDKPEKLVFTRDQLDLLMEAKFAELFKAESFKNTSFAAEYEARGLSETWDITSTQTTEAAPPRKICGNWADPGRSCKYTAEACPELHEFPSTWGQSEKSELERPSTAVTESVVTDREGKIQETCHFWSIPSKGCRYTAEECKYLHEIVEPPVEEPAKIESGRTCWYWATPGQTCGYTADECKFDHAFTGKIAPMPPRLRNRLAHESSKWQKSKNMESTKSYETKPYESNWRPKEEEEIW